MFGLVASTPRSHTSCFAASTSLVRESTVPYILVGMAAVKRRARVRLMERALVLGGGGITGVAWELGVLSGLREHGVDLTDADLIVGTSAGAVVGAQLATGVDPDER